MINSVFWKIHLQEYIGEFYGIGYATNKHYERSDSTSEYRYSGFQINPWFLFRLGKSNFFAGPQIDLSYDKISEPAKYLVDQPDYKGWEALLTDIPISVREWDFC